MPATGYEVMHCLYEVGMGTLKDTEKCSTMKKVLYCSLKIMVGVLVYGCSFDVWFLLSPEMNPQLFLQALLCYKV